MDYSDYKLVRDTAWKCLIDCGVSELPVKLSLICRNYNVEIIKNSSLSPNSPFRLKPNERATVIIKERFIIVDDTESRQAQRYSIAHELGHLLLGNTNEPMAERFAISLLAPACVLWGCNIRTAQEIASVCDISITAAKIRETRMGVLYERNRFLTSPLEQNVYENFKEFIERFNL